MCGDYNSVIGMNRDNSLRKFLKEPSTKNHFPALGEATISGLLVTADEKTGLANKAQPIILGGALQERNLKMAGHSHWAGIKHKKGRQDKLKIKNILKNFKRNYCCCKTWVKRSSNKS